MDAQDGVRPRIAYAPFDKADGLQYGLLSGAGAKQARAAVGLERRNGSARLCRGAG